MTHGSHGDDTWHMMDGPCEDTWPCEREEKEGGNIFKSSQIKKIMWVREERKERKKKGKKKKGKKKKKEKKRKKGKKIRKNKK